MKKSHLFVISLVVFLLDQGTKYLVEANLKAEDVITLLPFFNIVSVQNTGSAFGMFKSLGNIFFIAVAAIAMAVVSFLMTRETEDGLGFSLILGGAGGNMLDRLIHGYVIDFLDVHAGAAHWPAFNVADSALCVGAFLILAKQFFPRKASS
ncbi:MAG: signal peptidase II [Nitrospirales bacterium]|nr:signal peptidase II [Nitrospirales bacterium]